MLDQPPGSLPYLDSLTQAPVLLDSIALPPDWSARLPASCADPLVWTLPELVRRRIERLIWDTLWLPILTWVSVLREKKK